MKYIAIGLISLAAITGILLAYYGMAPKEDEGEKTNETTEKMVSKSETKEKPAEAANSDTTQPSMSGIKKQDYIKRKFNLQIKDKLKNKLAYPELVIVASDKSALFVLTNTENKDTVLISKFLAQLMNEQKLNTAYFAVNCHQEKIPEEKRNAQVIEKPNGMYKLTSAGKIYNTKTRFEDLMLMKESN